MPKSKEIRPRTGLDSASLKQGYEEHLKYTLAKY